VEEDEQDELKEMEALVEWMEVSPFVSL